MSNKCPKCKKNNDCESNFCSRCGEKINLIKSCPICLTDKKCIVLICGHTCCYECIDKQYSIKKECPVCRNNIIKCGSCNSFRVNIENRIEKCMDCKYENKIVNLNLNNYESFNGYERMKCIDCNSRRILYNPVNNSWNCSDCFCTFTINREDQIGRIAENLQSTTVICLKCCSNNLKSSNNNTEINCLNCNEKDTQTKIISLEEFSRLNIKTKEELQVKKKICFICKSDKIFNISTNCNFENNYYCNSCNKQNVKIEII